MALKDNQNSIHCDIVDLYFMHLLAVREICAVVPLNNLSNVCIRIQFMKKLFFFSFWRIILFYCCVMKHNMEHGFELFWRLHRLQLLQVYNTSKRNNFSGNQVCFLSCNEMIIKFCDFIIILARHARKYNHKWNIE